METFALKMQAIKVRLENNQALTDFCMEKFGKALKVIRRYKYPKEIELKDCPLIIITRPSVNRKWVGNISTKEHTVRCYGIFWWTDESVEGLETVADITIEFEELIEEAVGIYTKLTGDKPFAVSPGDTANDEGMFHPVFSSSLDFTIKTK